MNAHPSNIANIADIPPNIKPDALIQLCRDQPGLLEQFRAQGDAEYAQLIASGDVLRLRAAMMARVMRAGAPSSAPSIPPIPPSTSQTSAESASAISSNISSILHRKPEELIALCTSQPSVLEQLQRSEPDIAIAIANKDILKIRSLQMARHLRESRLKYEQERSMLMNPDDEDAQKQIEERIRLGNIQENMEYAYENFPESYGSITMLYVHAELNSVPIKAFVDSGAQATVMSGSFAKRCNLMRLVDTRYHGEVRGVGSSRIIGKIHITQMKLGNSYFPISITVLETEGLDFLLGLDMLRRYRGNIDLYRNLLVFHIEDKVEEVRFLDESEIPNKGIFSDGSGDGAAESSGAGAQPETEKMTELMTMGFSEDQARDALIRSGGSVHAAAEFLLNARK